MIDINNSQEYDEGTRNDAISEELQKYRSGIGSLYNSAIEWVFAKDAVAQKAKRELADPIQFMKNCYPGQRLWRFVLTHPDLDHMRGIKRLHEEVGFDNFWDTANTKVVTSFNSDADKVDWQYYQELRKGRPKIYTRGDSYFAFGKEDSGAPGGDNIDVLSPTPAIISACNASDKFNDISIVLRVRHAGKSILLPGDAEELAWDSMVATYGPGLKSDFLKASHHGRDTGYHLNAVQLIDPTMTLVSVGKKPSTDASHKYRNFSNQVASTRYYGNIELLIDDAGTWSWTVQHNPER